MVLVCFVLSYDHVVQRKAEEEGEGAATWRPLDGAETPVAAERSTCALTVSTEAVFAKHIAISVMCFRLLVSHVCSIHCLATFAIFSCVVDLVFVSWFVSNVTRNRVLHALFGNSGADAWQTYLNKKKQDPKPDRTPHAKSDKTPVKPRSSRSKSMMTKPLPANSRVPWSSLELLSDFTDGTDSLQPLCKATQNAKGVCFVELSDMESTLKLTSDQAFAVLVPAKKEKHAVPQVFRGKSYDLTIIARQAGVEVLKTCTCFQLGSREASLTIRTAEVSLPDAKTVEFVLSVACEPDTTSLHQELAGPKALDEWKMCFSQNFDFEPLEFYGVVAPRNANTLATVKVRVPAAKAADFELKSGHGGLIIRRWIAKGSVVPKSPVVWLKEANTCQKTLALACRFEGFLGLVRGNGNYGAKYDPVHITVARNALDPSRFSPENVGLVPTAKWAIDGFPAGTDREQVRALLQSWGWTVIPSQPTRSSWIVHSAEPPPASRCYASCGPLLIRSLDLSSQSVVSVMTPAASRSSSVPVPVSAPQVVPSAIPLGLKEEIDKAASSTKSSLSTEISELRKQISDIVQTVNAVSAKQESTSQELGALRSDINTAVASALSATLPSALRAALPQVTASDTAVPSPLRKKGKPDDEEL